MGRTSILAGAALTLAGTALAAAGLAGAAAPAATERSYSETRRAGQIDAHFSYHDAPEFGYERQRLTVDRGGRRLLDVSFRPERENWPLRLDRSLALTDLDGGEPEVIVSLFTGGANASRCTPSASTAAATGAATSTPATAA